MPFKLNINGNRPMQSNWDEVTNLYNEHCDANAMNDDDGCIYDFPANINTFISSKVPWKYQNVKMNTVKNNGNNKKLRMIRVWASMGSYMEDLLEIPEGGTVAGAFEITGLYYNDGKVILWDPTQPPEEASLGTRWREEANEEDPRIDDAHLDVMLFRMPRTIFIEDKYGKQITVQGTVRQVLQTIYESGYLRENYSGLIRTLEEALENSTTYIITSKDIGVTMSPERAKWQRKIKNIVGIEGTLNVMSYGAGQNRGRVSVYNDPTEIATESPANRSKAIDARRQNLNAYIQNKFRNYKNVDLGQGLVLKAEKPSATNKTWTNERLRSKKQWGHMNFNTSVENMIDTYRWKPSKYNEHSGPDPKQYECTLKNNFWKKDCPRYLKNTRNAYLNKERKEVENYSKKAAAIRNVAVPKVSATGLNTKKARNYFTYRAVMQREGISQSHHNKITPKPECTVNYYTGSHPSNRNNVYWNKNCPETIRKARVLRNQELTSRTSAKPKDIIQKKKWYELW